MLPTYIGTKHTYIIILKCREGSIVRKDWAKARLKTSRANSKLCISMSNARSPSPFGSVDCYTLLSLGLVHSLLARFSAGIPWVWHL